MGVQAVVPLLILANIVCSIGVIFANKHLFNNLLFTYSATLTGIHFVATWLFSSVLVWSKVENPNPLEWQKIFILSGITSISIWAQNLSLLVNSVNFYQVAKLVVIPCTAILQLLLYKKRTTPLTSATLAVLTLGVGMTTVAEVTLEASGFGIALTGVVTTSLQQIIYSVVMKDQKMNGVQLYANIGLPCAVVMLSGGTILDASLNEGQYLWNTDISGTVWLWIVISCLLACPMNFTSAMLLAKTNALTFQVVGHVKTVLVFIIGVAFFDKGINLKQAIGILVAMTGAIWYSRIQLQENTSTLPTKAGPLAK